MSRAASVLTSLTVKSFPPSNKLLQLISDLTSISLYKLLPYQSPSIVSRVQHV